jgi:hypothetical protein
MVGYLLELFCEGALTGATMMIRRPSSAGFQKVLPSISGYSSVESRSGDAPDVEEIDVLADGWKIGVVIESSCAVLAVGWYDPA